MNYPYGIVLSHLKSLKGEWQITTYPKDEDDEYNPDDGLDGGLCDGSAFNAVTFFINLD